MSVKHMLESSLNLFSHDLLLVRKMAFNILDATDLEHLCLL